MVFLVNCSNLKQGGGLQVADSFCRELNRFSQHRFIVVLSSSFTDTRLAIQEYPNVIVFNYDVRNTIKTIILGRDPFLDDLVSSNKVSVVLTVFGPSRWRPNCKHLCGFARAQLLLNNPLRKITRLKQRLEYCIWEWGFKKSSDTFYTENRYISEKLPQLLGNVTVFTVTNYYNQIFDQPDHWKTRSIPSFSGTTLLTLSSPYSHKNLEISADITRILVRQHPGFQFRFVFSIDRQHFDADIDGIEEHFVFLGTVEIAECPSLYMQCDIAFQPSVMECFTATYPEAMRMERPIVTTDLEFAHGLCGDAACYYCATDAKSAADVIFKVATDKELVSRLVAKGREQLKTYDNYEQRAAKLIAILENLA